MKTLDEYEAGREKKSNGGMSRSDMKMLMRDAVNVKHLTGNEHWDRYQSFVQASISKVESSIEDVERGLADPRVILHEHIMAYKMELSHLRGIQGAFDWVLGLPNDIIKNGDEAKEFLLEEKEAKAP